VALHMQYEKKHSSFQTLVFSSLRFRSCERRGYLYQGRKYHHACFFYKERSLVTLCLFSLSLFIFLMIFRFHCHVVRVFISDCQLRMYRLHEGNVYFLKFGGGKFGTRKSICLFYRRILRM